MCAKVQRLCLSKLILRRCKNFRFLLMVERLGKVVKAIKALIN